MNRFANVSLLVAAAIFAALPQLPAQQVLEEYDLEMYDNPGLVPLEYREQYSDDLKPLWMKALQRPDAELQRLVIDSIAIAHRRGVQGMGETAPRLIAILAKPGQSVDVSRAAVSALIELDRRDQAANLAAVAETYGPSFSRVVEPALARWKSPVMKDAWMQRVADASTVRR